MFFVLTCWAIEGNVFFGRLDLCGIKNQTMMNRILIAVIVAYIAGSGAWIFKSGFIPSSQEDLLNVSYDPTRELWRRPEFSVYSSIC